MATASKNELRRFGWLVGVILVALGGYSVWRRGGGPSAYVAFAVGAFLMLFGTLAPTLLRRVYALWLGLALLLGRINTTLLLGAIFLFVLTPLALLARLFRHDPLGVRGPKAASYWRLPRERRNRDAYRRLF